MSGPTIIGIGAQKCASSWVHAALGAHPQVAVSEAKEIDFFSYFFDRGYAWYDRHFESVSDALGRFENSPSYFHDPRVPERVFDYDPSMRILVTLRDPVERAYSNHLHEVIKGHIAPIGFSEGWRNNPAYLEQSLYARNLRAWLKVFPADQVLVVLAEDIAADPFAAAREIYGFAGVDPTFRSPVVLERRNESDRARLPWLRHGLRAAGGALRRRGLEESLARLKTIPPVAQMLRANSMDMRQEIPRMSLDSQDAFDAAIADDLADLSALLGRDRFPWPSWSRIMDGGEVRAVG